MREFDRKERGRVKIREYGRKADIGEERRI